MKLKFTKNESGEVMLLVDGNQFGTESYLEMVKSVKQKIKIELEEFDNTVSQDERESIEKMLNDINSIKFVEDNDEEKYNM